ncbi:hypothetical protein EL22_00035 [Halostagnicola sp. A56]|uniref:hypothetical protein n=1 Tax=Halostagnicola sp. A56 TaxID=1495067 RepID=UPI00049EDF3E|nr:hypothetical protein [Halostagnicola sp. A56]KDE60616.1 hypothetical protein EL22_00035 [Halostagnicola sp. A56]
MADITNSLEVEGSIVSVIHVDESGAEPVRTVLGLCTKDDLSVTVDESNEDFNPGSQRRTKRFRTNNTIDVEVASAVAPDLEALELIGVADSDGKITFDSSDRQTGDDEYLEIAYFADEPDFGSVDIPADSELLHRFADCEVTSPEIDPSATPPTASWTFWVEGDAWISYSPSA